VNFTYDPDLEAIAHLAADTADLEEAIRSSYLPAARRLAAQRWPAAASVRDQLGLTLTRRPLLAGSVVALRYYGRLVLERRG
jgi:hypothetical protein